MILQRRSAAALACLLLVAPAWAHDASRPNGHATAGELAVMLVLMLLALAYARGVARAWHAVGRSRAVAPRHVVAFGAGWLAVVAALLSPLDALAARSFAAHMIQHELLMVVAAPLLCLGRPLVAFLWMLSRPRRRQAAMLSRRPWTQRLGALCLGIGGAWLVHALVLWLWHLPVAFDAALTHEGLHIVQHLAFMASALCFWWSVLRPASRAAHGRALLSLFTTLLHTGALGALLAVSALPWYAAYASATAPLLDPLDDQQLGGLVMWVPAGSAYVAAGLLLAWRWVGFSATRRAGSRRRCSAEQPARAAGNVATR